MQANKYKLLKNLKETYCSFGVSKIHGIGVFAIRDIPFGTDPFPVVKPEKIIQLTEEDLELLPTEIVIKIKDIFVRSNEVYHVYDLGLNCMGIKFHVNHSSNPNIAVNGRGTTNGYIPFATLRDIKKGEELFWDYRLSNGDNILNQFKFIKNE
tara:strand:+ start:205 stop:663 length:459 start_codon:yes stop_codon:yes gene_type:complete